jgi:hypothetical protein
MRSTIELTSRAIRICRIDQDRITVLESWPVPPDSDPVAVLAAIPLPERLKRTRVVLHHEDILPRTMSQPETDPERFATLLDFELKNATSGQDDIVTTWKTGQHHNDEVQVLALVAKRRLTDGLQAVLRQRGIVCEGITHPAVGLFHTWQRLHGGDQDTHLLADLGGRSLHVALVRGGDLLSVRSLVPGADELMQTVATEKRIIADEAATLVASAGSPGNPANDPIYADAIASLVGTLTGAVTAGLRLSRTQLKDDTLIPTTLWLSGAGAQMPGLIDALAKATGWTIRTLNPFAGLPLAMPTGTLDRHAALPSPWAPLLGAAAADTLVLDLLAQERAEKRERFATLGMLKIAAGIVAGLLALGIAWQEAAITHARNVHQDLSQGDHGRPSALARTEALERQITAFRTEATQTDAQIAWLDRERRPGRLVTEGIAAIDAARNPDRSPVLLTVYRQQREGGVLRIHLEGQALSGAGRSPDATLRAFEQALVKTWPAITGVQQIPCPQPANDRQAFHFVLDAGDVPVQERQRDKTMVAGHSLLRLTIATPDDSQTVAALARAAALRARDGEAAAEVQVVHGAAGAGETVKIAFKD